MKRILAVGDRTLVQEGRYPKWIVSTKTTTHERLFARVGVTRAWCGYRGVDFKQSYARSVMSLIADVHSPFDYSPVHARWDVVY